MRESSRYTPMASMAMNSSGEMVARARRFDEDMVIVDTSIGGHESLLADLQQSSDDSEELLVFQIDSASDGIHLFSVP